MNFRSASLIFAGLVDVLALASCARVASTSVVDGGQGVDIAPGSIRDVPPANPLDAPPGRDAVAPDTQVEFACGAKGLGNAGCSFYAAQPPLAETPLTCYAIFVVNPGNQPAHLTMQFKGATHSMAKVARLPRGAGTAVTYQPFDPMAGLAPGDVALVFLSGTPEPPDFFEPVLPSWCPTGTQSVLDEHTVDTGSNVGDAFHLTSDRPVVAYDINPYGGPTSYVTSASLLLPEEAWSSANLVPTPIREAATTVLAKFPTYVTVIAAKNDTEVSIKAPVAIAAGRGASPIRATPAGQVLRLKLSAGQYAQVSEEGPTGAASPSMSGTLVSANKPVAVIGGSSEMNLPADTPAADSVHQQIPPFSAWGTEYAAISHRSRLMSGDEPVPWMLVGAADGTVLTYSPKAPGPYGARPVAAPVTLKAGQVVQFWTAEPFVVRSQDANHPFFLGGFMTSGDFLKSMRTNANQSAGDPEFVNVIATEQYMKDYTFLTDPTYSETNLVVVRKPGADGKFADVKLACAATPISGWKDVGALQYARVDLVTGNFQPVVPGCNNGVNRMSSAAPFSLTVWGWGTMITQTNGKDLLLGYVSYGYPAGAALGVVNQAPDPVIQ